MVGIYWAPPPPGPITFHPGACTEDKRTAPPLNKAAHIQSKVVFRITVSFPFDYLLFSLPWFSSGSPGQSAPEYSILDLIKDGKGIRIAQNAAALGLAILLLHSSPARAAKNLTTVGEVKRLSSAEAATPRSVALRGVVTQVTPEWWSFSLQDPTDGVYVSLGHALPPDLQVGTSVQVEGQTVPGNFAPSVKASSVTVLGHADMPLATKAVWKELVTGSCDNRYVEVEGVVRYAALVEPPAWDWQASAVRLDVGGNLIWAYLRNTNAWRYALTDATVRIRGVCVILSNSSRQFQGVALSVARTEDLAILEPGPKDPFNVPTKPIRNLFGFQQDAVPYHRVKLKGTATLQESRGVYIQDGTDGILVAVSSAPTIRPGDLLEAIGFPDFGESSRRLDDAQVRIVGQGRDLPPRELSADKVLVRVANAPAAPDAELVRIAGRVVERITSARQDTLILTDGETTFSARLSSAAGRLDSQPGSRIAITGVCLVQADDHGLPNSFELVMRSRGDITVLERAPWLTRSFALRAAGALSVILVIAFVALAWLRLRLAHQTETIRRQFEREASLEQRYSDLVENASDLVYVRDLAGRLLQVNRGTEQITGYTRQELLSMSILDMMLPAERERAIQELACLRVLRDPHASSEWHLLTKDGRNLVIETKSRLLVESGVSSRVECIGRDVTARHRAQTEVTTERDQLQEQLQHSQKLDSVGRLAGGVAHDFNNLLTIIGGYAKMALDDLPETDPLRDSIGEIVNAAERATGLTRQLLLFSRREKLSPSVISLNHLLGDIEKMVRRLIGEDVAVTLSLDSQNGLVFADRGHIEQVVMNLVVNARDAMPEGGKLEIRTSDFQPGEEYVRNHLGVSHGEYVLLEVVDTGTGMTPEVQSRIFEPFFTTKEQGKGTGLGLSLVYGIIKQTGGSIFVNSEPGRGTRFEILFPAANASDSHRSVKPLIAATVSGTETILLAEDEVGVRKFVSSILRSAGYTVLESSNGSEALQHLSRHSGPIHLLLTDVVMPEMGGVALAQQFAELRPGVPILYMSGYTEKTASTLATADLLEKPFDSATLLRRLRKRLAPVG
jgi:PAS domain S-box-containing protein